MTVRITLEVGRYDDGRLEWNANADFDRSPAYDASGPDPLAAAMELARVLGEELQRSRHDRLG